MACDICGKVGSSLESLLDCYSTTEIKDICPDCARVVNEQLHKIKKLTMTITERSFIRFINVRKENMSTKNR